MFYCFGVPYPAGRAKVTFSVTGQAQKCINKDGTYGVLAVIKCSIKGRAGVGPAVNANLKRVPKSAKPKNGGANYRYRKTKGKQIKGRYAKGPDGLRKAKAKGPRSIWLILEMVVFRVLTP